MIYEHAKKGDRLARELLEETGRYLAVSLGNVLNLLDLETIILGAGFSGRPVSLRANHQRSGKTGHSSSLLSP